MNVVPMRKVKVAWMMLPARSILNMGYPSYMEHIAAEWTGQHKWWNVRYEPLRVILEQMYVRLWNKKNGMFSDMMANIAMAGMINPIMVSAGSLQIRRMEELPPEARNLRRLVASEYLGDERLWVAQKLDLQVPCIVNDFEGKLSTSLTARKIPPDTSYILLSYFQQTPREVKWLRDGSVYVNGLWEPMARDKHEVLSLLRRAAFDWLREHDA